jgi:hypothetical protein
VVKAGLRITHSFTGWHATTVQSFLYRLVCENGMTHRECVSSRSAHTRRLPVSHPDALALQTAQVRRLAKQTWQALDAKLESVRTLQDEPVDATGLMIRWIERARLSTRYVLPRLRQAWEEEGSEPTIYGVVNAFTRAGTHGRVLSARVRRTLMALGGTLAFHRMHLCPQCFSMMRAGVR